MAEPIQDKHRWEKFEFPLWKLIKQYAEEKDISYGEAADFMINEYAKCIRYGDTEFEQSEIRKRREEVDNTEQGLYKAG